MLSLRTHARAATILVAGLLAGCGGGGHAATMTTTTSTTTTTAAAGVRDAAFVRAFETTSGLRLERTPTSRWTLVSPAVADTSRAIGTYGSFSVYVLRSVDASLAILLRTAKGTRVRPDAKGIYYAKGGSGTYSASTLVAPNVFVRWQGTARRTTGRTFRRLVADVRRAVAAAR